MISKTRCKFDINNLFLNIIAIQNNHFGLIIVSLFCHTMTLCAISRWSHQFSSIELNIIHMTTFVSRSLDIHCIMYNVQDHSVLYNNTVRPVICEVWEFTHIWILTPASFHKERMFGPIQLFNPRHFLLKCLYIGKKVGGRDSCICVLVVSIVASFYYFDIWF